MQSHLVTRILTHDYLLLVPAVAVGFNLLLVQQRRWRELAIFNLGGGLNVAVEIALFATGTRVFDTSEPALLVASTLSLGWVTNGFLFCLAYINVRHWMKRSYPPWFVLTANAFLLVGVTLAMVPWGILEGRVTTWRKMSDVVKYVEPAAFAIFAATIWMLRYRRLLWRLVVVGCLIDLHFEGTLLLFGVRPMGQFDPLTVGLRVLFEMNTFLCLGFLVLKGIYRLPSYRDPPR